MNTFTGVAVAAPLGKCGAHRVPDFRGTPAQGILKNLGGAEEHAFAAAWRHQPKWVVSRSLKSVGPNATLVEDDIEAVIGGLKAQLVGEIDVAGPDLAGSLTRHGLIDEYRLYLHPVVLGRGKPFFAGPRPPLRLVSSDRIAGDVIRLTYVPASAVDLL